MACNCKCYVLIPNEIRGEGNVFQRNRRHGTAKAVELVQAALQSKKPSDFGLMKAREMESVKVAAQRDAAYMATLLTDLKATLQKFQCKSPATISRSGLQFLPGSEVSLFSAPIYPATLCVSAVKL